MSRLVSDNNPHQQDVQAAGKRDVNCYEKARARGQLTFTVVEQDLTAPGTILDWIDRNFETAPIPKLRDAFETALAMRASTIQKKNPD